MYLFIYQYHINHWIFVYQYHIVHWIFVFFFQSAANLSVETLEKGLLTPKSNVWSFGVVLLELITGRKNLDASSSKEEHNLVKWSRPFLTDDSRLSLIMDSRIKGRFPTKAARIVADIILKCLHKDPSERPTMRDVVEALAGVQEIKEQYGHSKAFYARPTHDRGRHFLHRAYPGVIQSRGAHPWMKQSRCR